MAFKCLTSMIEEWITDDYCIMSLLNHIVPLYMYGKLLRDEVHEKAVRGYSLKSSSHIIKSHFDMRLVFRQT